MKRRRFMKISAGYPALPFWTHFEWDGWLLTWPPVM